MTEYSIKRQNGSDTISKVNQSLEKVFTSIAAVEEAIANGEMKDGELFSTIDDSHPNRTMDETIREMQIEVDHLMENIGQIDTLLPPDVSTENLIASVNEVLGFIAGLDTSAVGGSGKYIKSISQTDGIISATEETFDTTVTQNSGVGVTSGAVYTAISNLSTSLNNLISALDDRLKSTVASSDKAIPESEIDTKITNAVNALDVAESGGTNKYIKAISEADGKISATEGTVDTVVTLNSDNLITSGAVNSALAASETALQGNINAVSAKISSTASSSDKVPATSEVTSAISTAIGTEVTNRDTAISTAVGNEATARDTAITNAINALDVSDAAVANQYVSQVSETNGKISVTRASLPTIATFTLSGTDLIITY